MASTSVSLKDPNIVLLIVIIAGFMIIIALSAYVLWLDINTEYTWIMPLNRNAQIWGYYKWNNGIGIYDLAKSVKEPSNVVSLNGLTTSIGLASSSTSYAIILARGINIYVVAVVLLSLSIYIVLQKKLLKIKTYFVKILLSILIIVFIASMLAVTIPYIDMGHALGYSVTKDSVSITVPVKTLSLLSLNSSGIPGFANYTYVYILTDNVIDGSLVHARFILNDSVDIPPLMIVRVVQDDNVIARYIGNEATFYVSLSSSRPNGEIRIYILTDKQLNNSLIEYARLSFVPMGLEPPVYLMVTPLIGDALLLGLGYWIIRKLSR